MTQAAYRIAAALTHRNFRLLWFGALTSSIGTWMQKVAQAWLIVTMTGSSSAFYLGLDSFAGEVPILLFTLIGGVVADRRDRRHMMLVSQVIQMCVAIMLAVLVFTGLIQIWMVLTLSFISGCGTGVWRARVSVADPDPGRQGASAQRGGAQLDPVQPRARDRSDRRRRGARIASAWSRVSA